VRSSYSHVYPMDSRPLPTQTSRADLALAVPPGCIVRMKGTGTAMSFDQPLATVCGEGAQHYLAFISTYNIRDAVRDADDPLATVTTIRRHGLVLPPFIAPYNGTDNATGLDQPVGTVTSVERFGLAVPPAGVVTDAEVEELIDFILPQCRYRMLEPEPEIQAAMDMQDYTVLGNRRDRVVQYGNAVIARKANLLGSRLMAVFS
jgi:DNA (cytosine-5)-methyltransferase 1